MSETVDLCSDGETPVGKGAAPPTTSIATAGTITLISSDDDTPLRPAQKLPVPSADPHADFTTLPETSGREAPGGVPGGSAGSGRATSSGAPPPQAEGRAGRPRRAIKRAYGDEYDLDYGGSQSMLGDDSRGSPKRQKQEESWGKGSQATPDSKHPKPSTDGDSSATPKAARKGRARMTAAEKAAKEAEKQAEKERKKAEREEVKRRKEAEKLEAKAQKELQKLQQKRDTGKTAMQDIVLHLDSALAMHKAGRTIMEKVEETYKDAAGGGPGMELSHRLPMWPHRCATWSRKMYPAHQGGTSQGEPTQQSIPYTLVHFTAEEFVERIAEDELEGVVRQAGEACPGHTLALLVEGLEHYLTLRQRREFKANGPGGGGFNRAFVDDFLGGMVCRWPGVRHALVHDTAQAGEYVCGLTRTLAEQPFRAEAAYLNSFGAGKPDTVATAELLKSAPLPHKDREVWFKCLCAVPKVGPKAAHAVAKTYASMGALIAAYHSAQGSEKQKAEMLQHLPCYGGSRVGPAASRELYRILLSTNPNDCC